VVFLITNAFQFLMFSSSIVIDGGGDGSGLHGQNQNALSLSTQNMKNIIKSGTIMW